MSITFRTALTTIALCAVPSVAAADPHRLVILDFDGPVAAADAARAALVEMLGAELEIVPTERSTGADTVIAGWVQPEETGPSSLTVEVRDAASGRLIDSLSVKLTADNELSEEIGEDLHASLEDTFSSIGSPDDAVESQAAAAQDAPSSLFPDTDDDLNSIAADLQIRITPRFDLTGGFVGGCSRTFTLTAEDPAQVEYPPAQPESSDPVPNLEIEF